MAGRERGWAPLWRALFESETWVGVDASTKVVIVWIIGNIRHTPDTTLAPEDRAPSGSVDVTIEDLAVACGLSRSTTQRALRKLEDLGTVSKSRRRDGLRIAFRHWEKWRVATGDAGQMGLWDTSDSSNLTHASIEQKEKEDLRSESSDGSVVTYHEEIPAETILVEIQPRAGKVDFAKTVDHFHRHFVEAYGSKPTWGSKEGMLLKRLIKAHGSDEVRRRVDVLFSSPPPWLKPPFTVGTLSANFDHLVQASTARRGRNLTAEDVFDTAARLAREGR